MVDVRELIEAIKEEPPDNINTYSATVSKVDNEGVVWVYLAGSNKETPVTSASAEVKSGDNVNVEWRNNRLYIAGNTSNPSAGVTRVRNAEKTADVAHALAQGAQESAQVAQIAADSAIASAGAAAVAAGEARESAIVANEQAIDATASANAALTQLGVVENVVGVLEMVQKHGVYSATTDTEVQPNKWYFTREGSGTTQDPYVYRVVNNPSSVYHLTDDVAIDSNKTYYTRSGSGTEQDPYVYTEVENPVVADIGTYYEKYYELSGIDSTIQNYVSSHLVLTESGLSLRTDQSAYRIDIAPTGIMILDGNGMPVAEYGETAIIGSQTGFNVRIGENANNESEIGFYSGSLKIAYMNGSELYVTNSLSFGHFSFVERANGHFTLKLIRGD